MVETNAVFILARRRALRDSRLSKASIACMTGEGETYLFSCALDASSLDEESGSLLEEEDEQPLLDTLAALLG